MDVRTMAAGGWRVDEHQVSFDIKDLLADLRRDVRTVDDKLDFKADRDRVHGLQAEIAAMRLQREAFLVEFRTAQSALIEHDQRLGEVEGWRWRVIGGFGVAALFFSLAGALFLWVVTGR